MFPHKKQSKKKRSEWLESDFEGFRQVKLDRTLVQVAFQETSPSQLRWCSIGAYQLSCVIHNWKRGKQYFLQVTMLSVAHESSVPSLRLIKMWAYYPKDTINRRMMMRGAKNFRKLESLPICATIFPKTAAGVFQGAYWLIEQDAEQHTIHCTWTQYIILYQESPSQLP